MKKIHLFLLFVLSTVLLSGCFSCGDRAASYRGGNLSPRALLSRAPLQHVMPDSGKFFAMPERFIELDHIDFTRNKKFSQSVVYNEFELDEARELSFIAGADYYFTAYLNGEQIFTTHPDGNGDLTDTFEFSGKGKKGKNLLAIEITRGTATSLFFLREGRKSYKKAVSPLTITGSTDNISGAIKPMNAVNNAPKAAAKVQTKSNMKLWQEAKIPYARTHDASIAGYGSAHIVDVHMIFPDFSKDPCDPASYDFTLTDIYCRNILEGGSKIFYRLGSRIEHSIVKYGTKKPADFKKWAIICEHIIKHYTEGWANGFKWDIQYWEIWNEPDLSSGKKNKKTWGGTDEEFFEFYRTAATHLKKKFPHLKIGGPAIAGNTTWLYRFLDSMTRGERVPIDFFSWHAYAKTPAMLGIKAENFRRILNRYGYNQTESILDEWNYIRNWNTQFTYSINTIIGIKGAAFAAAAMCVGQDSSTDMMMYYDARPATSFNGLFYYYDLSPLKTYYVIKAWSKLAELGKQFKLDTKGHPGMFACGATDGKGKAIIMVSRYFEEDKLPGSCPVTIKLDNLCLKNAKVSLLDKNNDFAPVEFKKNRDGSITFSMEANTVILVEK